MELKRIIKTQFLEHQKEAYELGIHLPSFALFMEPGTGKTLPTIAMMGYRFYHNNARRAIVVCPLSVVYDWERQLKEHAAFPYNVVELDKLGTSPKDCLEIVIVNYEKLWEFSKKKNKRWEPSVRLMKYKADIMVCDESHKIKNWNTHATKAASRIGKGIPFKAILTGTPVTKYPLDLYSQINFLDSSIFDCTYKSFRERYAVLDMWNRPRKYKDLDHLMGIVYKYAYRKLKKDVKELPPPEIVRQNIYVTLEPRARKLYEKMAKEAIVQMDGKFSTAPIPALVGMRCHQIAGGYLTTEGDNGREVTRVSKAKLNALVEYVKDSEEKLVIFAQYIPEIHGIVDALEDVGIETLCITGATSKKIRGKIINQFQSREEPRVIVIQISTGGVGITLTAAHTMIFYSLGRSYTDHTQACDRINRIGQQSRLLKYIYLIAEDTVDELFWQSILDKKDIADYTIDDLREILAG